MDTVFAHETLVSIGKAYQAYRGVVPRRLPGRRSSSDLIPEATTGQKSSRVPTAYELLLRELELLRRPSAGGSGGRPRRRQLRAAIGARPTTHWFFRRQCRMFNVRVKQMTPPRLHRPRVRLLAYARRWQGGIEGYG